MRLYCHFDASKLILFSLPLLLTVPRTVTLYRQSPTATLNDAPYPDSVPRHHAAPLDDHGADRLLDPNKWAESMQDPPLTQPERRGAEDGPLEEEVLLRAQRGDLVARLLSPLPGGRSREARHYLEGGEGEDGGKRNEALTSIAGGLHAVSREKGGFGFRFGRKRWSDRRRIDEGRGSTEENKWK